MNPFGEKNSPGKKHGDDPTCGDRGRQAADELRIVAVNAINEAKAVDWDACANPFEHGAGLEFPYNPFVSHAFLSCLEVSKSATARAGWQPQHVVVENASGQLLAVAPCYLKSH